MNLRLIPTTLTSISLLVASAHGAASTGQPFYGDAPDQFHPWAIHDHNRPQPKVVTPGSFSTPEQPGKPPSDAIILFDGTAASLDRWQSVARQDEPAGPTKWIVKEGAMECVPKSGYIQTKDQFGDCHLHIEWAAPRAVQGNSQGRGNSGIFLLGVEIQVLDSFDNPTYADGSANSVYSVNPPLVNALRPPGEFQVVDIVFRRPVYQDGRLIDPGYVTVFCNGVLVQDHTPLEGPTGHLRRTASRPLPEKGPLRLQDHGNPVRYRNIWYRPLPPRAIEGGTDGMLTAEATAAKRKEIAATIRADAAKLAAGSTAHLLRLAESLVYEKEPSTTRQVEQLFARYAAGVKPLSAAELEQKKGEISSMLRTLRYLAKFNVVAASFEPLTSLDQIEKKQGWDDAAKKKDNPKKKKA